MVYFASVARSFMMVCSYSMAEKKLVAPLPDFDRRVSVFANDRGN